MAEPLVSPPVLQADNLSKAFGGLFAVRNVTLDFTDRTLHAVIGPNGAGKSTFVNLLSGQLRPSGGQLRLRGRDVTGLPPWRYAHLGIARSYQRTNIFRDLSVLENARMAAQATRANWSAAFGGVGSQRQLFDIAEAALERVGLLARRSDVAGTLSHGAQRQLEIAMTLVAEPQIILLDEPLAGMGQDESERMARLMKDLARDYAVLLIEHDMDFVFQVADEMTVLVEGSVLATGKPADIRANSAVQTAYLGGH